MWHQILQRADVDYRVMYQVTTYSGDGGVSCVFCALFIYGIAVILCGTAAAFAALFHLLFHMRCDSIVCTTALAADILLFFTIPVAMLFHLLCYYVCFAILYASIWLHIFNICGWQF